LYLPLLILGMVAFILLLYKFIIYYSEKSIQLLVERKHRDAEAIINTGNAPPDWGNRGLTRLGMDSISKVLAMRRLSRIISYIQHSPFVEDEDSRKILMDKLNEIRERWESMQWYEIDNTSS